MTWIDIIDDDAASPRLLGLFDRIRGADGHVDNIMRVHGLRPHTLEGHMALYKATLHHTGNALPTWLLEAIGVCVSLLNRCDYCVEHHFAGLRRLLQDDDRAAAIRAALEDDAPEAAFDGAELAALRYARTLTLAPGEVAEEDVVELRDAGLDDGQILEVNQVASYFAYANRTVLGLGVDTRGDVLGLSPPDTESTDDWRHG
jgi:uncharacterized peroxidase-related enzyme